MGLSSLLKKEAVALRELYDCLIEQNKIILNGDVYNLNKIVENIKLKNKEVALCEVERIKVLEGKSLKTIAKSDDTLNDLYTEIRKTVNLINSQNKTNQMLLKQKLYFNEKVINILLPSKSGVDVYDSLGKIR